MTSGNGVSERFVVCRIEERKYSVLSLDSTSGKPRQYCVQYNGYRWLCNCPHYLSNCEDVNFVCKHIVAVMQTIGQQTEVVKRTKTAKLEDRIKKLEERIEALEVDVSYAINPANYS
jgi:hypothetical protein